MTKKLKVILTTTLIYEPNPENYVGNPGLNKMVGIDLPTIEEMAKIDLDSLNDDSSWVVDNPNSETQINVIVVDE